MKKEEIFEILKSESYPDDTNDLVIYESEFEFVAERLVELCNLQSLSGSSLPLKIERIIAVVAQKWGSEYGGTTIGILGQDAIDICEQYGIDWKNYC